MATILGTLSELITPDALTQISKVLSVNEWVVTKDLAEAKVYGDLVMAVATNVAHAATEGGFLGIAGKKVTDEEQATLNAISTAIEG